MLPGGLLRGYLAPVWRIVLVLVVFQIVGIAAGLLVNGHHNWFMNFWLCAALATPIGFVVGFWWQCYSLDRRRTMPDVSKLLIGLCGVLSLGVGLVALFDTLPRMRLEMGNLESLQALTASEIRRIAVYSVDGPTLEHLHSITDSNAIASFAAACRDAVGYSPNHPRYATSWYIVIVGTHILELQCHFQAGDPTRLYGYFVEKKDLIRTSYKGSFSSVNLYGWFEQYVVSRAGKRAEDRHLSRQ